MIVVSMALLGLSFPFAWIKKDKGPNWSHSMKLDLDFGLDLLQDGDLEPDCVVKVDDCGFFIYWKSESRVSPIQLQLMMINVAYFENQYSARSRGLAGGLFLLPSCVCVCMCLS